MSQTQTPNRSRPGRNLDNARQPIDEASHAPGYVYSDAEVFELEKDRFFMRDWLFVGRVEEFENTGDFLTWRIVGEPIIISRNENGDLNAFYNMCLHRGAEVVQGRGNAHAFSCPYHGWVYDLSGKLKRAAYMEQAQGFDPAACRLQPLGLDTWAGNIFVSFNPDRPPLEDFVREFDHDFGLLHPEECRLGNKLELELDCNWKFVSENLMDFYHVGVLHANSFGEGFAWEEDNVHLRREAGSPSGTRRGHPPRRRSLCSVRCPGSRNVPTALPAPDFSDQT